MSYVLLRLSTSQIFGPPFLEIRATQFPGQLYRFIGGQVTVSRTCDCVRWDSTVTDDVVYGQLEDLAKYLAYAVLGQAFTGRIVYDSGDSLV